MKLEKWALGAEIVSGFAIVVTLVILIVELRGNTSALQAASLQALADRTQQMALAVAVDPDLAAIQAKFIGAPSAERMREVAYLVVALKLGEESYLQYQSGVLAEAYWLTRAEFTLSNLGTEYGRDRYYALRDGGVLVEDFVTWLDAELLNRYGE